jgi:hypothetical protein
MDSNRILDVIADVRSKSNITFDGSFIVGLPHESISELYQTHEFLNQNTNTLISSWYFHSLSLFFDSKLEGISEIEKDPTKFGYEIFNKQPESFAMWKNKYMNSIEAKQHTDQLNVMTDATSKTAGWSTALAWHLDLPDEDIKNLTLKELNFTQRAFDCTIDMSLETLSRFGVDTG